MIKKPSRIHSFGKSVKKSVTGEEKRNKVKQGFQSSLANVKDVMHDFESRDRQTKTRSLNEGQPSKLHIGFGHGEKGVIETTEVTVTETTYGESQAMRITKCATKGAFKVALFVAKKHLAIAVVDIAGRQIVNR
jgi:hypothetical protein